QWLYFNEYGLQKITNGNDSLTNIKIVTDMTGKKDGYCVDDGWSAEYGCMIRFEDLYKDGKRDGIQLFYKETQEGQWVMLDAGMYKDNLYAGQWQYFHDNGMLHEVVDFPQRNTPNVEKSASKSKCPVVRYRENGQKSAEGWYLDPGEYSLFKFVDDWTYFFPDGETIHIHY
ncbi:MAG: hypothetical protein K2M76_06995, partial [Muribaculaceae bacterium]|nr:hypothetical protein [Muribaculaceae bacterium]